MTRKIIIVFLLLSLFAIIGAYLFSPGLNIGGQHYHMLNISSSENLKNRIYLLKNEHPEYRAYSIEGKHTKELIDRENTELHYYTYYFYLDEIKTNVTCIVHKTYGNSRKGITLKLFSSSNSKSRSSSWKRINSKDLSKEENEKIKYLFETQILDKLGKWHKD